MRILSLIAMATLALTIVPTTTHAQSNRALEQLSALNRINPLQNPEFERSEKVIDRKIVDRKNKVVGTAEDIILNQNGTIASIQTDFDRLRLGNDVNLNFRTMRIRTISNAYALNMDADEIADFYPQLLSDIETASGDGANTFSARKIIGAPIRAKDGRRLGKVKSILFGANGGIASAVYAEMTYGTLRGETLAIPFRSVNFKTERGRLRGTVDNQLAGAMIKLADD